MKAVNLLPPGHGSAIPVAAAHREHGGTAVFAALGALALVVVALAAYVLTGNEVKQHAADLTAAEAQSAALTTASARLKPYADFAALADTRTATVRDLAAQRFDWEGAFRDLARVMPEDVTVKTLTASASSAQGGGSALRTLVPAPAITLDGCASDQRGVARTLARLRAVAGVTRVTLAKSTKPVAAPVQAPGEDPVGCDAADGATAPDFQIILFFERDTASSLAASGASGAAAPPSAAASSPSTDASAASTTSPSKDAS